MVQKIVWTEQSKNDLLKIKDYISADSAYQAERIIKLIYSSIQKLIAQPDIGKIIYTSEKYLVRRLLVKSYRIIYTFHSGIVSILAVQHQSRELETYFDSTIL